MILTKSEYLALINDLLPDNSTQQISPLDLRTSLINLVDSVTNFIDGDINADNFSTPATRNTRAGILALSQVELAGRSSYDSSAFGYAALKNTYTGEENTAIGAYALSCSLYGTHNTAVGFQSQAGRVTGSGNVTLGSYALNNNKHGDFNVAIGHGAGYYATEGDYKLYVGAYPVDSDSVCVGDDPVTIGDTPLMYGSLQPGSHFLVIGSGSNHGFGMLQVHGDASPTFHEQFNLGNTNRSWETVNEVIYFSGGDVGIGGVPSGVANFVRPQTKLTVYGDLVPSESGKFALGHPSLTWDGYFNDILATGQVIINDLEYNTIEECLFECKTLHLATSGFCDPDNNFDDSSICGLLSDESLDGAGFEIHSSGGGNSYRRDYRFIYRSPDPFVTCLEADNAFTRSRFQSNISLQILDGRHLQTNRIINNNYSDSFALIHQSGCMGLFIEPFEAKGQRVTITQEPHFEQDYPALEDVNMISRSGEMFTGGNPIGYDYSVMYGTIDSGVQLAQKFKSRIKSASTVRGFSIVYHDELDT